MEKADYAVVLLSVATFLLSTPSYSIPLSSVCVIYFALRSRFGTIDVVHRHFSVTLAVLTFHLVLFISKLETIWHYALVILVFALVNDASYLRWRERRSWQSYYYTQLSFVGVFLLCMVIQSRVPWGIPWVLLFPPVLYCVYRAWHVWILRYAVPREKLAKELSESPFGLPSSVYYGILFVCVTCLVTLIAWSPDYQADVSDCALGSCASPDCQGQRLGNSHCRCKNMGDTVNWVYMICLPCGNITQFEDCCHQDLFETRLPYIESTSGCICGDGGRFNGTGCACAPGFTGLSCEFKS